MTPALVKKFSVFMLIKGHGWLCGGPVDYNVIILSRCCKIIYFSKQIGSSQVKREKEKRKKKKDQFGTMIAPQ